MAENLLDAVILTFYSSLIFDTLAPSANPVAATQRNPALRRTLIPVLLGVTTSQTKIDIASQALPDGGQILN